MDVSFATEPAPGRLNEDHVVASDGFAIVLDGVSTPPGLETGCRHDTRWFVRTLGGELAGRLAASPRAPLDGLLAGAIERVRACHGGRCDLDHPETPSTTVAMIRERDRALDYLVLCDSSVVFEGAGGCWVVTDDRTSRLPAYDRATVAGLRNSPRGFWVAASLPSAARHALAGTVARDRLRRVALCTDGASRLVERFGHQWQDMFAICDRAGPRGVIDAVRAAERTAPPAGRRGKISDDATVVVCELATVTDAG